MNTGIKRWTRVWAVVLMLAGTSVVVTAEDDGYTDEQDNGWSLFNRPRKDHPADQLAHAMQLMKDGRRRKARGQFKALVRKWPYAPEAAAAQFHYAQILEQQGKALKAFDAYQMLIDEYPGRFPYEKVLDRQFEIAVECMNQRKSRWFFGGIKAPERAIPYFNTIIENGPAWHRAANAQYLIGKAHENNGDLTSAINAYTRVQLRYPKHPVAEEALYHKTECLRKLSRRNPNDKQMADEALANLQLFIHYYPDSRYLEQVTENRKKIQDHRAELTYKKAHYYDRIADRKKAALTAYRLFLKEFPDSEWTKEVKERIVSLKAEIDDAQAANGPNEPAEDVDTAPETDTEHED